MKDSNGQGAPQHENPSWQSRIKFGNLHHPGRSGEPLHASREKIRHYFEILFLFAVYFVTARLGLKLGAVSGFATLIWPPSGISLAALLIFGRRLWPGIALGAFFVNWSVGAPPLVALAMSAGNTLEPILGAYFLKRVGFRHSFDRLRDIFALIVLAAFLSTLVSATIGVTSLLLAGNITQSAYRATWEVWWLGDAMANLLITPFFLVWSTTKISVPKEPWRVVESLLLMVVVVLASFIFFTDWLAEGKTAFPKAYFIFPILMLVAVRLGQRATITSIMIVSTITLVATSLRHGRFTAGTLSERLFEAQIFLAILAFSKMVLAAAISERRKERDTLQASNAQREAILNASLDSIVTIDHEGRVAEFNPAAEKTFGYKRSDVIGREMASLIIPPRLREAHRKGLARYLATGEGPVLGKRIGMPAMRVDGSEFPIELSILPLKMKGPPMFTGFIQDITERKQTEDEKKFAEESSKFLSDATQLLAESIDYKTTLKHAAEATVPRLGDWCVIQIIGEEGKVQSVELACAIPEKEPLLRTILPQYLMDLNQPTITASAIRTKQAQLITDFSEDNLRALGAEHGLIDSVRQLAIKSIISCPLITRNKVVGAITLVSATPARRYGPRDLVIFEDLARRAAIAIENAKLFDEAKEAIRARDEFLSIASHELKTPLTSLSLQLQLFNRVVEKVLTAMKRRGETSDKVSIPIRMTNNLASVEGQCKRLSVLLDELLDLTRIRLGRMSLERERIDLSSIVSETVERFKAEAAQKGISISVQFAPSTVGVWDPVRIEQVVSNLISNAIKYGAGKPVSVMVEKNVPHRKAVLLVQDHGMGIPPEMREKIFERFERAGVSGQKIAGLGLGLYITRQIVEAHGGSICVESEVQIGSKFIVILPLDPPKEEAGLWSQS